MSEYKFTDDMREISGLSEIYEQACRDMIVAGLEWLDRHPDTEPKFSGYQEVTGIIIEDNDAAKELSQIVGAAYKGCSGAQHHASIAHILHINKIGWKQYVEESTALKGADNE